MYSGISTYRGLITFFPDGSRKGKDLRMVYDLAM